jgi:hypothetical protein
MPDIRVSSTLQLATNYQKLHIIRMLGEGAFARVYVACAEDNTKVALKVNISYFIYFIDFYCSGSKTILSMGILYLF